MTQGQAFGKYELLQRVSAGGMAEVFRAIHTPTGTRVALKRILPQIAEDEEFIEMFEDEARIASQLEHPHIARCLDYGHVDKTWFITYEYVSGKDLRALFDRSIKNGEFLPLWFVVHVMSRIGEGLAYAHARRDDNGSPVSIVHRDVSPMNIIVAFNGDVKLIDFGIAKAKGKLSRTLVGTIKGKFGYMSPEQVRGEEIDQRADIFALGICAWELLTLKRLFQAENEILVLEKIRSTKIEPPSYNNPDVPAELDRIVMKALAKEPTERYRAARELYRDLNNLAQNINGVASREQIAQYMRRVFPEAFAREESTGSFSWPRPEGKSVGGGQVQENRAMAAENKGSSDLDIFEGLGKKGSSSRPPPSGVHPPAPPPRPGDPNKKTLLGMQTPIEENGKARPEVRPSPSSAGMQAAKPASSGRTPPPPPPGRGSLPPVVPPPKSGPPSNRQVPAAEANALEMDWDDEEEQTHVFDKDDRPRSYSSSSSLPAAPPSARSAPPPVPSRSSAPTTGPVSTRQVAASGPPGFPPPPPPTQPIANPKSTLLGLTAGNPPPPPSRPLGASPPPPPPPSLGSAFSRSSAPPAGLPAPPPTIDPLAPPPPPPPPPTQRGLGLNRTLPVSSTPPPPPPQQVSTVPLPMPGPPPGSLGMPRPTPHLPPPPSRPSQALPPPSRAPMPVAASSRMEETALVRPQPGHWGIWIALAVLIVVVFGGGAGYYFLVPHTGRMVINVTDNDKASAVARVEVYVDGSKRCETTPCLLDKIEPGSHSVRVFAQGYDQAPDQFVNVEARKEAHADFTVSMTSSAKGTGLKVAGTQAGLRLRVDGRDIGPLPQELHDLQPGNHSVEVVGTERYQSFEKNIIVAENETVDLGSVTLKVIKGKATINLATSGAKVYLVSGSDRRELPSFPISVDITDMSKTWSLEAQKPGFLDYRQPISFDDGQAEKLYNVELTLKGTVPTATNTAVVSLPPPTPAPPTPPAPPPTTQQPPAAGDAWITINSIPPSTCYLDGRALGMTPKPKVHVSPGRHSVKFVNSDLGITKDVGVTVGAGETKFAVVNLNN